MKEVVEIFGPPREHWVGDGFPVKTLFSYDDFGRALSPFLLLDRAGPKEFLPAETPRGVGQHPHRGFETVTIVYSGEVAHKDSAGNHGVIGPGGVQWMTAASGILHEEFHSEAFTQEGGLLDMVQLWVNLPADAKMSAPNYQGLSGQDIAREQLPGGGYVRVIAGDFNGTKGAVKTHTPMDVLDVQLTPHEQVSVSGHDGWNTAIVVLDGTVLVNDQTIARTSDLVILSRDGGEFYIEANADAKFLILAGEPINEPIVGQGPFVMNTEAEIRQAFLDMHNGTLGHPSHVGA